jgi:hypothetical protein
MAKGPVERWTDSGSRVIKAPPRDLYREMLDPQAIAAAWRSPSRSEAPAQASDGLLLT